MNEVLENQSTNDPNEDMIVVITKRGDQQVGLVIDKLEGQLEIVIKPLGKYMTKCRFISGATILGDGEIALILDTNQIGG
jgi:two-component system chemotaxis sensor kinase CheA